MHPSRTTPVVPELRTPRVLPDDAFNRALTKNVRPGAWENPDPAERYNLVVIGGGTAGLVTAIGAAGLGARVALVERHLLGGDCLNVGCVPSKALLRSARALADVRDAGAFGIDVPAGVRVDFPAVMERMRRLRAEISPTDSAARLAREGVDVFFGEARFGGADVLDVDGTALHYKKAVIATGSRAAVIPIEGLADVGPLTNESVFSLTELPPRLAIIGGGAVGCELAQAFARFGSKVTLLEVGARILSKEDPDAVERVERELVRDGVQIVAGCKIHAARRRGEEKVLTIEFRGVLSELIADEILVGAGRTPNIEGLGLEAAGIEFGKEGIKVDDRLRTTNRRVFAAGDVASRYQFTHAADALARIVIQNALFFGRARASALTIPWCTYTDPEIAHVGMYEKDAEEKGIEVTTFVQELAGVDRARLDGETEGFVKVHVRTGTDKILGATVVARHASEIISELTLSMTSRLGLRTLARTIHPYPTQVEAIKRVADSYTRTRLTPFVRRLLERFLAWTR